MPPQSRVTDNAFIPADVHGCPVCPHPCIGPGTKGSPTVLVNGLNALRIGDRGTHAPPTVCCGLNTWAVATGSSSVLFNGIPAARIGDSTAHCGGIGSLVMGSPNVIVGG